MPHGKENNLLLQLKFYNSGMFLRILTFQFCMYLLSH